MRRAPTALGVLAAIALAVMLLWLRGMRQKDSWVVVLQRRVNRAVINPQQRRSAGKPGASASMLRHTGRRSGRPYATPVGAVPTGEGFVIALVYGSGVDWARNVLASGQATIVHEGRTYRADRPEVVPMSLVVECFTASDRRAHRRFAVTEAFRVRAVAED